MEKDKIAKFQLEGNSIFIEAENFQEKGGWVVDQQFIANMGSPYLLAHGLGVPVKNASTIVNFPLNGKYYLWVRTKNWCNGDWEAPGQFQIIINGNTLNIIFGTIEGWQWQKGGEITITKSDSKIELKDLTGFDGRCDALFFTSNESFIPPNNPKVLQEWRNQQLNMINTAQIIQKFDVVIVGGGIAGCAAALVADCQGLKVALINDRPVLGGNASSEIRVHAEGIFGKNQQFLEGVSTKSWPNGSAESIKDEILRHNTMKNGTNIHIFQNYHAYSSNIKDKNITSIDAKHIETGESKRYEAPIFIDCTGDGSIGFWAGANFRYGRENFDEYGEYWKKYGNLWSPEKSDRLTMGSSLLWNSKKITKSNSFPDIPWAKDVAQNHSSINGEWYWEFAQENKDQIFDAEEIRDHLLRAIYGSFANAKKKRRNRKIKLDWVGYILGKRESRRLMGDYVYSMKDMTQNHRFPDAVVEEIRAIDVHHQQKLVNNEKPDFLSTALFFRTSKYFIPYRCFYSNNISNLLMAGRCFSCSHIGLGGPRVMNTTGQMGIATGYAASLCKKYNCTPREIYEYHIDELLNLVGY